MVSDGRGTVHAPTGTRTRVALARWRLALVSAGLVALVFAQAPGRVVADTKLDLVVDPGSLLARALHLWQPFEDLGHVPNQLVGYLFPMGPFFALGDAVAVPAWALQRAWLALLLVVAMVGVVRLGRAFGMGSEGGRVVAGLAYALAPSSAALAGTSAALLPAAVLPWALLPLVRGAWTGSARRAAAASGLAVAAMGAVNAAAVLAVLPVPVLWLLTRRPGPRRRRLAAWWLVALTLATAWWGVALAFQSRYGVDFLAYTERAGTTTGSTSAIEVLRGAGGWLAYLNLNGPWVPGGWVTAALPAAVVASALVAALGMYGLARRDLPERQFLLLSLLAGLVFMAAGYAGPLGGPAAEPVRAVLDGPLAPLRNVGKFFPLLRLPLALGLAHTLGVARLPRVDRRAVAAVAVAAVVATAAPFVRGELYPEGSFEEVPAHWREAARWVDRRAGFEGSLLVPAAPFGEYVWGRPLDEPLQSLAGSPWMVRDLVNLGSPGTTVWLDGVDRILGTGLPSPGLAPYLNRAGVRFVVVRNDLDWRRSGAPRPAQVRSVLAGSPGLVRVAGFGPPLGELDRTSAATGDQYFQQVEAALPAVEVYRVRGASSAVALFPADAPLLVTGGPEAVLRLAELGMLDDRAAFLAGERALPAAARPRLVVTDSLRRQDVDFGQVRRHRSYTLGASDVSPHSGEAPRDYEVAGEEYRRTEAVDVGARRVSASSYGHWLVRLPGFQPAAAFDGDPVTAWVSGASAGHEGEWVQIDLLERVGVTTVGIRPLADGPWRPLVRRVRVVTEQGSRSFSIPPGEEPLELEVDAGPTEWVRVVLEEVAAPSAPEPGAPPGLREVTVPGVTYRRPLEVPPPPKIRPASTTLVFGAPADRESLVLGGVADEEARLRRHFHTVGKARVTVAGTAVARPGGPRDALVAEGERVRIEATSARRGEPAAHLLDGDERTTWVADAGDAEPVVRLAWRESRTVDRVQVAPADLPGSAPARLRIVASSGVREVDLPPLGEARFEPLEASGVEVSFPDRRVLLDPESGQALRVPVGLSELRFPALADLVLADALGLDRPFELACGSGPHLRLDDQDIPLAAQGTVRDLAEFRPLSLTGCDGPVDLRAGEHGLEQSDALELLKVTDVTFADEQVVTPPSPSERRVRSVARGGTSWRVEVAPGETDAVLALPQGFHPGWTARLAGSELERVRLDGWRQGWLVPAEAGGVVVARFGPDRAFRLGLLAGMGLLVVLLVLALLPAGTRRRWSPAPPRDVRAALLTVVGTLALAVAGGLVALLVPAFVVAVRLTPRVRTHLSVLAGTALLGSGLVAAIQPASLPGSGRGAFGATAQALALVAVAALVAGVSRAKRGDYRARWVAAAVNLAASHNRAERLAGRGSPREPSAREPASRPRTSV